ncbi:MAG: chemotaxis protein CheW [Peptococcales bacterium]|jgi:purine-binding chemotaxis protein CheW
MEEMQIVAFNLANEEYGVDILNVQEIIRPTVITRVPKAPSYLVGVINLRGNVVPVIDLRKRFGITGEASNEQNCRIIILSIFDLKIGITVDRVTEVLRLSKENIEEPSLIEVLDNRFVQGVGKFNERLIILLDLVQVLELTSEKNPETTDVRGE